jgi:cyclase
MNRPYEHGLHEVADGVHAWIQPDGTWGYSNAGLVVGSGASVLVDTLFDLSLTRSMLDAMTRYTATSPIRSLVNTHANGDHCYGNQLVAGPSVEVIASETAAREIDEVPPALMAAMVAGAGDDEVGRFVRHAFGRFDFDGIDPPPITTTFTGEHRLTTGQRTVELIEVGPAHTGGDVIAWLPDERVVFTGDIAFIGGTPIMWAGPVGNWIAACERIDALQPEVVVPGHGPITDVAGLREVADYLRFVRDGLTGRHEAAMSADDAIRDLDAELNGTRFASWTDRERLFATAPVIWSELDPTFDRPDILAVFAAMAADHARRR